MRLLDEDRELHELASMLKVDQRTVRRWCAVWRRDGPEALQAALAGPVIQAVRPGQGGTGETAAGGRLGR